MLLSLFSQKNSKFREASIIICKTELAGSQFKVETADEKVSQY